MGTFSPHQPIALEFITFQWQGNLELPRGCCLEYGRAFRLWHALILYLYSMNRRAAYEDLPLIEPMYWHYSGGNVPTQFMLGAELIVSPVLEPADRALLKPKRKFGPHMVFGSTGLIAILMIQNNWREGSSTSARFKYARKKGQKRCITIKG